MAIRSRMTICPAAVRGADARTPLGGERSQPGGLVDVPGACSSGNVPGAWVELALQVDVRLVLADPAAAVTSRWAEDVDVMQASRPILDLMLLYVQEDFLVEAAQV